MLRILVLCGMNCKQYFPARSLPFDLAYSVFVTQTKLLSHRSFQLLLCMFLFLLLFFEDYCFFLHFLKFHDDEYLSVFIFTYFIGIRRVLSIRKHGVGPRDIWVELGMLPFEPLNSIRSRVWIDLRFSKLANRGVRNAQYQLLVDSLLFHNNRPKR